MLQRAKLWDKQSFAYFRKHMESKKEWFAEWFNSPYYHILYGHRDMKEAEFFLRNLIKRFNPPQDAKLADLACGAGRHSIFLNSLGFDITGIDLSEHSIAMAKPYQNDRLHFEVGDLRCLKTEKKFDIALNLFTSFGYFDSLETDLQVMKQVSAVLQPGGYFLIDFLNAEKVLKQLVPEQLIVKNEITFHIKKEFKDGIITKDISFEVGAKHYHYQEKVQALQLQDFETLFHQSGFVLIETFGNYGLEPFVQEGSERLILIAKKNL